MLECNHQWHIITEGNLLIVTFLTFQVFRLLSGFHGSGLSMTKQAICLHFHSCTYSISPSNHQINDFTANSCQSQSFQQVHVSNTSHFNRDKEKTKPKSTPLNTACTRFAGLSLHFPGPSLLLCSSGPEKPARRSSR